MKLTAGRLRWIMNIWPPFWGAGVRVDEIKPDYSYIRVSLKLRWYNQNYVGVHFGGSLFSMTDPFFMLILLQRLGKDFIVWDKQGEIQYLSPGKGRVTAEFKLSDEEIEQIRQDALNQGKTNPFFSVTIYDENQQPVAIVKKTLYVKSKNFKRSQTE
ncbi:hypothetical protein Lbir_2326 [Legionella birminghamensis]|uniref:DUF4442 domain-containing protein n=1 Tax=Legionella birminghamensis TaxID=28083 RepID=A0A378IE85_9GAMM|nr:DUF4442 domain-containing protein [Legionella birminghamensis]KTC68793.1 hypothetical protein Lbir_2326 [Legionella birminghamensis]STX33266.1 Uncharacterised protein [Legionella birminghamensis]